MNRTKEQIEIELAMTKITRESLIAKQNEYLDKAEEIRKSIKEVDVERKILRDALIMLLDRQP